jgi:ABC-type glycerol-3-phosphate transport system substrate-binding protein
MTSKARLSCILIVGVGVLVAGCGGSTTKSDSSSPATTTQATSSATASADSTSAKVSANTASDKEIESALATAGVSNPGRWTHEVVEYRPYPMDDPNLQKLRDDLAKYNPGEETVDKIVSALTP